MPLKRALLIEDDERYVQEITQGLKKLGLEVERASSAEQAMGLIRQAWPDLLLASAGTPAGHGLSFCEMLATDRYPAPIPAIILLSESDQATATRCRSLGADSLVKKPGIAERLRPMVRRLLDEGPADHPAEPRPEPRILIIDDDGELTRTMRARMEAMGVEVLRALTGMHGYWTALREAPNAIVINLHKPDAWVTALLKKLRGHSLTRQVPILVFNPVDDPGLENEMARLGGCAYLRQPLDFRTLKKELEKHLSLRPIAPAKIPVV